MFISPPPARLVGSPRPSPGPASIRVRRRGRSDSSSSNACSWITTFRLTIFRWLFLHSPPPRSSVAVVGCRLGFLDLDLTRPDGQSLAKRNGPDDRRRLGGAESPLLGRQAWPSTLRTERGWPVRPRTSRPTCRPARWGMRPTKWTTRWNGFHRNRIAARRAGRSSPVWPPRHWPRRACRCAEQPSHSPG